MKLHVGGGTVYLTDGYTNIDIEQSGAALASECPDGVRKWGTTSDNYYGNIAEVDSMFRGNRPADHETTVTDAYGSCQSLPFDDASADEILCVQTFEHLSRAESRLAMAEFRRVLKVGGYLRLDVPDFEQSLWAWNTAVQNNDKRLSEFLMRHLVGSAREDWAYHTASWTEPKLIEFCKQYGFVFDCYEPNRHLRSDGTWIYPAIAIRFKKIDKCAFPELDERIPDCVPSWKYAGGFNEWGRPSPLIVPYMSSDVLEIGPGNNPWPWAGTCVDIVDRDYLGFVRADVQKLPASWTERFDFVFASHVMEHVDDPLKAVAELNRVAKCGCIVCPSPMKEGMFAFHEQDHKWWILQSGDTLIFKRIPDGLYPRLYNQAVCGQLHRTWLYGDKRLETMCNPMRRYFRDVEPLLDVVHKWGPDEPLKAMVLK